jgi:16S rRNA (adenine1518-N6/adenine1519-N6)-dimethyltransferase
MRRSYSDAIRKQDSDQSRIKQKKSLGQVFLNTDWPVRRIVENTLELGITRVIEIGPGNAILTDALSQAGIKVTAIEKDDRFANRLSERISRGELPGVEIINTDILQFDLGHWINASPNSSSAVLGNIPYNISTPIFMWTLPHLSSLKAAIFMVQLEFAQRVAAAVDTKDYGSLSVYCQLRAICELNFKVEKTCFTPIPKVDSAVLTLRPRPDLSLSHKLLQYTETICRIAFTQRRKKLRNTVKPFLHGRLENDCPIDLNRRAETLMPADFVKLAEFLFNDKI